MLFRFYLKILKFLKKSNINKVQKWHTGEIVYNVINSSAIAYIQGDEREALSGLEVCFMFWVLFCIDMLCFVTLEIEPRALQMLRKRSTTELHHSCYKKFNRRSTYEHHTQISKCDTKLKKKSYIKEQQQGWTVRISLNHLKNYQPQAPFPKTTRERKKEDKTLPTWKSRLYRKGVGTSTHILR